MAGPLTHIVSQIRALDLAAATASDRMLAFTCKSSSA
jgi:hypothetical protein